MIWLGLCYYDLWIATDFPQHRLLVAAGEDARVGQDLVHDDAHVEDRLVRGQLAALLQSRQRPGR